ncbi:MAG: hypothetical protein KYX67_13175 [Brevundimonas sp.]|jgi:hypothetical protein|uniref:hypothetical protein n=1 Tax=Brevundimonas sp. TaxID=1871086 RepID=UPI002568CA14|nr:hypothetical protein [Brevundimonas sp.]MDK2748262.1 hypothetical protein [Brevundimonas sp.]
MPKYAFEREARDIDSKPGTRLIDTMKTGDLASPITWFRPNQTAWRYAIPDPVQPDRFSLIALYFDREPSAYMVDTDCSERRLYFAGLDEPATAPELRDVLGRPVKSGDGRFYRMIEGDQTQDGKLISAFCDTDWKVERTELRTLQG